MENSQQREEQEIQDDRYSNLTPKEKPEIEKNDNITNPDPEKLPGVNPDNTPTPPGNPSQYPVRHPDEIPVYEPNEVPMQNPDEMPDYKELP